MRRIRGRRVVRRREWPHSPAMRSQSSVDAIALSDPTVFGGFCRQRGIVCCGRDWFLLHLVDAGDRGVHGIAKQYSGGFALS